MVNPEDMCEVLCGIKYVDKANRAMNGLCRLSTSCIKHGIYYHVYTGFAIFVSLGWNLYNGRAALTLGGVGFVHFN